MKKTTSYTLGSKTEEAIEEILNFLEIKNHSEVVRRSIALMKIATLSSDKDKTIELKDLKTGVIQKVLLI